LFQLRLVSAGVSRMPGVVTPAERPKLFKFGGEIYSADGGDRLNRDTQETTMNKTVLALAAATSLAVSVLAAPPAEARCWGCAVGIGVAAGVVTGAIVGSAIANSYGPAYAVQPGYAAYPGYAVAGPVACPGGYWARRPVAFDAYGNPIGWSRPRFFCP
jgi:hypothetical protein